MAKTGSKHIRQEELELIRSALQHNEEAFSKIYALYHKSVLAVISKYVKGTEDIEDICMQTFEKAFKQLATYNQQNSFATWIFTIARNTAFDHMEKEKTHGGGLDKAALDNESENIDIPTDVPSPEESIITVEDHENLLTCIEGLPDLYRDIARMCFVGNLGYREIAEKQDIPINTVKTRISRAKTMIINSMQEMED